MNQKILHCLFYTFLMCLPLTAIAQGGALKISPVVGARIHSNGLPVGLAPGGEPQAMTAPMIGFEISTSKIPVSLSIQKDWDFIVVPYNDLTEFSHTVGETWTQNSLLFNYSFNNNFRISLGCYLMRRENALNHEFGSSVTRDYKGLLLGISRQIDWLTIGIRSKINLSPHFDAGVGWALYSLVLSYRFEKLDDKDSAFRKHFLLSATLGARFFPIRNIQVLPNEEFGKIGIAPTLGIELLHRKSGLSFNIERDFWISLNGGSSLREVKGLINSTFVGFRYHHLFENGHHIRVGLGYSFIRDLDRMALLIENSQYKLDGLFNYQVKGIGLALSFELFENADVEVKHTIPIRSIGEKTFNPLRFSLGVIYRLNGG